MYELTKRFKVTNNGQSKEAYKYLYINTPCSKKVSCLMFDNNFGKILSPIDSSLNSLSIYHKDVHFTCNILLHYLVKFKNLQTQCIYVCLCQKIDLV